ncbi:hypothetical protein QAD02_018161 [Eretmocerus hayati]|uniref:Uncharacterized protein n=1 Tax=Eretmocerus hayati TaxID=131215 RepID=A0ACC2PIF8_9HYME|nr:hypothetical protein QAD02_018161 [Eretmocerus hayati]
MSSKVEAIVNQIENVSAKQEADQPKTEKPKPQKRAEQTTQDETPSTSKDSTPNDEGPPATQTSKPTNSRVPTPSIKMSLRMPPPIFKGKTSELKKPRSNTTKSFQTIFDKIDITRIKTDSSIEHTVDVQSDFRFVTSWIFESIKEDKPIIDQFQSPFVSLPSLAAYEHVLYVTMLLLNDLYFRATSSNDALEFSVPGLENDFLKVLQSLQVPPKLAPLLIKLIGMKEPA